MSQPPYGSNWPPQQPDWGSEPPQYPNPTQPLPQYPNPTQPLPPYQPPAPAPAGQWGAPPPGPPYQPPYPPGPPGPPWDQPPPRRNTTMIVVLAIVGLLVVGGGVTGIILATTGKKHETQPTNRPTTSGATSAPDFPTGDGTDFPSGGGTDVSTDGPTGLPTDSGSSDSVEQDKIAVNAQTVLHALGDDQPNGFCSLVDPADLKRLLQDKHLDTCNDIALTSSTDKAQYRSVLVADKSAITITGNIAVIPSSAITPPNFGGVEMRKDTDGIWKYRFYTS